MTRGKMLGIAALVLAVAGGVAGWVLFTGHRAEPGQTATAAQSTRGPVPAKAWPTVNLLLSADGRRALTPQLNAVMPRGSARLFPAGSRFTPIAGSWRQTGDFANVSGILHEPGKPLVRAEIGLMDQRGRWLITFEEAL